MKVASQIATQLLVLVPGQSELGNFIDQITQHVVGAGNGSRTYFVFNSSKKAQAFEQAFEVFLNMLVLLTIKSGVPILIATEGVFSNFLYNRSKIFEVDCVLIDEVHKNLGTQIKKGSVQICGMLKKFLRAKKVIRLSGLYLVPPLCVFQGVNVAFLGIWPFLVFSAFRVFRI